MSEISKLYENAGVEKCNNRLKEIAPDVCLKNNEDENYKCEDCEYNWYPEFTAEKQIAIFKIFCKRYLEVSQHVEENGDLCFGIKATVGDFAVGFNKDFAECLANFVNSLWQSLTEEKKEQIREILK